MTLTHGHTSHCGIPYHQGKKTWVYNVEVYQRHRYFVGKQHVLAHNPCGQEEIAEQTVDLVNKQISQSRTRAVLNPNIGQDQLDAISEQVLSQRLARKFGRMDIYHCTAGNCSEMADLASQFLADTYKGKAQIFKFNHGYVDAPLIGSNNEEVWFSHAFIGFKVKNEAGGFGEFYLVDPWARWHGTVEEAGSSPILYYFDDNDVRKIISPSDIGLTGEQYINSFNTSQYNSTEDVRVALNWLPVK